MQKAKKVQHGRRSGETLAGGAGDAQKLLCLRKEKKAGRAAYVGVFLCPREVARVAQRRRSGGGSSWAAAAADDGGGAAVARRRRRHPASADARPSPSPILILIPARKGHLRLRQAGGDRRRSEGESVPGEGGPALGCVCRWAGGWLSWRIGRLRAASSGWSGCTATGATSAATTCTTRQGKRWCTSWLESAWFTTPGSTARNSSSGTTMILSGKGADFSGGGVGWGLKGREENVVLAEYPLLASYSSACTCRFRAAQIC